MKLYNTLTKEKNEFIAQETKTVKMYVCGPTVYNYSHIGNLRTYINTDILRRFLKFSGYKVIEVMNITDIDDKTIKKAADENIPIKNVTQKYEKYFLEDLNNLDIELPEKLPHATDKEVIEEIIKITKVLLDKKIAYKSEDGSVYFSVKKFKDYGKLSGIDLAGIKDGARVSQDEYDKDDAQDFVLWKKSKESEPSWETPFGKGRPGWHIECSAMSTKYLGDTLDIHAGGVDLIFPHHENEIAQSETYTGKKFVNYWFHCGHLMVEREKMSKSLGNIYTLHEMSKKYQVEPLALRMLSLMSHYRETLNFTEKSIKQAQSTLINLREFVIKNLEGKGQINTKQFEESFVAALDDDLNMPKALAALFEFIKEVNIGQKYGEDAYKVILKLDKLMGLNLKEIKVKAITEPINKLIKDREKARQAKNWELSDNLRTKIEELGYTIEDTQEGQKIK